jgi:toxin ParE2
LKARFLAPARSELRETVSYYNSRRPRLGEEFRDEAWETIRRIKQFPQAWHPLGGSIRRCQMQRFPYGIIYEATEQELVIIAIANLHKKPEYWRSRVNEDV